MKDERNLQRMLELIDKILRHCSKMSYDEFEADEVISDFCVFNLSQLGEVSHRISDAYVESHSELVWNELYGLRNRLVHDYEGTNFVLVWEIVTNDLPALREKIEELL